MEERAISWRRTASKNGDPPCARIVPSLFGREFFGAAGWLLCGAARIPTRFPLLLYVGESVVDVGIGGVDMICVSMGEDWCKKKKRGEKKSEEKCGMKLFRFSTGFLKKLKCNYVG